jgi:voltage-gated potassium channel Kch
MSGDRRREPGGFADRWRVFRSRWRYDFDELMSKGASAQIVGLLLVTAFMIVVIGTTVEVLGIEPEGRDSTGLWYRELLRTLDPGVVADDQGSAVFLLFMVLVTFGGIFVVGTLIGILSNAISDRLDSLRKGRSRVHERDHFVILGWSPEIFTILRQLVLANEHRQRSTVVVLALHDKVDMEEAIRSRVGPTGRVRVVCRTGDPVSFADLDIAAIDACRAIVVLTPEHEVHPDALVIKTLLAITNSPQHRSEPHHVVVELRDPSRLDVATLAGRDQVEFIIGSELTARLVAQTCRNPGLSAVFEDLLGFAGDELYIRHVPALVGHRFGDAVHLLATSSLVGLRLADGRITLRPPADHVLADDELVIAIAANDEAIRADGPVPFHEPSIVVGPPASEGPTRTLVLGSNHHLDLVVAEFDRRLVHGSTVTLAHEGADAGAVPAAEHLELRVVAASPTDRADLERLAVPGYDHVVLLAPEDVGDDRADADTLMALLHVRDIARRAAVNPKLVTELATEQNKALAQMSQDDDFIVSSQIRSEFLTQVVMDATVERVFDALLSADEAELQLRPVGEYVVLGVPVAFASVLESTLRREEVAIGHRLARGQRAETHLNPHKATTTTYGVDDRLIVLAAGTARA